MIGRPKLRNCKINGVVYDSMADAARKNNVSLTVFKKHLDDLGKSNLSEIERYISVKTKFVFQKVK